MKVLAPISRLEEVDMLVSSGAEEFYVGFIPYEWVTSFTSGIWMNRRAPQASIPSFEEFASLVDRAHTYGVEVFMTLNAPYYVEVQYPILLEIVHRALQAGTDGFIVSDIGLMIAIKDRFPDATIHVSSLATPINSSSIHLYRELGASRIVFPRSLSLHEMKEIIDEGGRELEYEIFILNDGCIYEEGFCFTTHNQVGAFCSTTNWEYQFMSSKGKQLNFHEQTALGRHLKDYEDYVWYTHSCGCSVSNHGIPLGPCGLCALPDIYRLGIDSLKIVGREADSYRKLASVQLVSSIVKSVRAGMEDEEVKAKAKRIRKTPEHCQSGYMCYYR
ncbi:peptidase U32 family protein [Calidifontibacillus erzurumensis]|uniref:U32 family peptidase n=1 Tax=Calidifontibacillus erzurumensis TaxID=2741433 RepID=A0A8J8GGJ7_9BACI|nr:U32 family peptidase [Calidifontibacillus erzurumensis]NSL51406.1 U32 family peptidase [Calidifontibacillus erzurumensis]